MNSDSCLQIKTNFKKCQFLKVSFIFIYFLELIISISARSFISSSGIMNKEDTRFKIPTRAVDDKRGMVDVQRGGSKYCSDQLHNGQHRLLLPDWSRAARVARAHFCPPPCKRISIKFSARD